MSTTGHAHDQLEAFRVHDPREIAQLLRDLVEQAVPTHIKTPQGPMLSGQLQSVEPSTGRLHLSLDPTQPELDLLERCDEAMAVAHPGSVKLEFPLAALKLRRNDERCTLTASAPARLYRVQRRGAFRVRLSERDAPTVSIPGAKKGDAPLHLRVIDICGEGCALLLPSDVAPIAAGRRIQGVEFHLDEDTRFHATLLVHHAMPLGAASNGAKLGCSLTNLSGADERALQRFIMRTQKRQRWATALI